MDNWPFKYVNGVQTPDSKALESNSIAYIPNIPLIEDALV